ncbi:SprB repeat-containing protein [Lacinutrix sp. Hel_I_90]|uniref:beta strand repeat-containing protein n=1 Tax=Lacinutrix sp. Hel_I_90 TaxID=1249999 RepID=UPI0009E58684|nr:SprB repeat-containing protein [Lacinutrix sp. Hel_I_90]
MKNPTYTKLMFSLYFFVESYFKRTVLLLCSFFRKFKFLNLSTGLLKQKKTACKLVLFFALLASTNAFSQLAVPFSPRLDGGNIKVKGDVVFIGNSIIAGEGYTLPYNGNANNNNTEGIYINVESGGDPSIFSSSSAGLAISSSCKQVVYAGLYWASVYPYEESTNPNTQFDGTPRFEDWNEIKFKLPTGGFIDLVADDNPDPAGEEDDIIFDGYQYYGSTPQQSFKDSPIICYKNVTNLLQGLGDANGDYTVANLRASRGRRTGGCSAGWTLVVIYEDPTLPSKYITTFDGYAGVQGSTVLDIPVSGYQTLPIPFPVRANIGVGALEGDLGIRGDSFRFKATTSPGANYTALSDAVNPANNFFNSNISLNGVQNTNRNPASLNTLGLDINNVLVPNPSNTVIPNNSSSGDLRLTTSGDGYGAFVASFAVEIIEPDIILTKIVEDDLGNNVGNQTVGLGQSLNYVIGFQNTGNEDAVNFTIRDILPINIVFNYPSDLVLPAGVTVASYNPTTREIIFNIADYLVEIGDPVYEIRIETNVVVSCSLLVDVCSDTINNQAFATYGSALDPSFIISDDPSYSTNTGCLIIPQATNFLADLDDCSFTQNETLCGASLDITAGSGYDSYSWSTSPSGTPVIGTTQTITVTSPGTYYSFNTALAPCQSIEQEYVVTNFGNTVNNPVIPYADEVVICPNDGKELPNIYLCGANASTLIETGISDASSIIWEQLDETSCAPVIDSDCANENAACTWNQVGTGPDFLANTSGQFRLTLNYAGGCFNQFYFNVYQNLLAPAVTATDIICTTPGSITVTGVPNGYEYSLDGTTYQSSNVFSVTTAGLYTVYIRQLGVSTNPCVFTVPDIQIRVRNFTVSTTVTQPFCNGDLGNIQLAANDVDPQYFFSIYQGATLINSIGPISGNNYTFGNLNPGTYTVNVETEDGCTYTEDVEIIEPALLTATSALTMPLTCTDGEITVYPVGGTAPYFYFVNSTTDFQTVPEIVVTAAGTYNITVVDSNNCVANTSITVAATPAPEFTISSTDILCADAPDSGSITINVTNANGNSLAYSIDGGVTFSNGSIFTGLSAGDYDVVVEYTLGSDVCLTDPQTITIAGATPITGTATLSTPYTCTTNGTITVTGVSGGLAPYSYSIDGVTFQVGNSFTGLTAGTYTITVQDANNCTSVVGTITIAPLDPPTDLMFSNTALTCPSNTSDVTITTTGGTPTLEYQIIAPAGAATPYQASNVFTGLAPGTYTFQVNDANACTYSESYTITALPALTVVGQNLNDITCFGASDGSIQFTVSGSTGFNYTLNGGASTAGTSPLVLTGLGAGSYTIVVTDTATNCDATATLTVNAPPAALAMTTTVSPITCLDNGSVVINATGGWGSNMYSLTLPDSSTLGPQTSNTFVNLTQVGTYIATVVDANGCTVTDTFDLTAPTGPVASISVTSDLCYDTTNGATLEVTASGGVAPYEYNINGGAFQSSNIFTNVVPGTYTIIVRDAYGCEVTLTSQTIAPQLTLTTVLTKDLDCTASPDAVITGTITGGYAPFTYAVSINSGGYTSLGTTGSPFTYTASTAGTYQFEVTDAEGCIAESGITTIAAITSPTATATPVAPLCFNGTNGEVQLFASGGSGGYTFSFNGSGFTTQSLYTNLSGNVSYSYQVQDSNACLSPVYTISLTNPTEVEAAATIPTNTTCSATTVITVTATGGTGSYSYSFQGGAYSSTSTYTVSNTTTTQTITYSVRDTNGCIDTETIDIPPYNPVTGMTFADNTITCNNTTTDVTITPTGGVAPFTFTITAPAVATGNTTGATTGIFTGLTPGNYTFEVTDANGCAVSASHVIAPAVNLAVSGTKTDEVCFGASDGQAIFTITDVSSPGNFTYTITPASGTATQTGDIVTVTGLAAGTYTIDVTDITTGCVDSASVTINAATQINFTVSATNVNCNNPISTLSFPTLTGGSPGYTYAYVASGSPAPALGAYSNGTTVDTSVLGLTIDVYVKDTNDCVVMIPVTIISDPTPTVTLAVDNQCTASGSNYTITASASSGVAPYTYSIDGINFQTSATFTVSPGTYTVTVRDANGCTAVSNTVTVYPQLTLTTVITKDLDCTASPDAIITGTINGGSTPFTYSVSINSGGIPHWEPPVLHLLIVHQQQARINFK